MWLGSITQSLVCFPQDLAIKTVEATAWWMLLVMRLQSSHSCLYRLTPATLRCFLCFLWTECCHLSPAPPILTNTNCLWTDIHCLVSCVWSDETHIRAQLLSSFFDGICTFRLSNSVHCDVYFLFLWWCRWTSLIDKLDTAAVWRGSSQWIDACGIACWCKTNKRKRWAWKKRNRCVTDIFFFPVMLSEYLSGKAASEVIIYTIQ